MVGPTPFSGMMDLQIFGACCCGKGVEVQEVMHTSGPHGQRPTCNADYHDIRRSSAEDDEEWDHSARMPPTDVEDEKARLQKLVSAFARRAAVGCPCTYLDEHRGRRSGAQYSLDKDVENLSILPNGEAAGISCPLAQIRGVHSWVEDGESWFPEHVLDKLSHGERGRLVAVTYSGPSGNTHYRFCLLEETPEARDSFVKCVKILSIYAQTYSP